VLPPGELVLTSNWCCRVANWTKHMCRLWFWPSRCIMWTRDVIHKTGSKLPPEEDRAMATDNMYKIWWNLDVCFLDIRADRQPDRQIIAILHNPTGSKLTSITISLATVTMKSISIVCYCDTFCNNFPNMFYSLHIQNRIRQSSLSHSMQTCIISVSL